MSDVTASSVSFIFALFDNSPKTQGSHLGSTLKFVKVALSNDQTMQFQNFLEARYRPIKVEELPTTWNESAHTETQKNLVKFYFAQGTPQTIANNRKDQNGYGLEDVSNETPSITVKKVKKCDNCPPGKFQDSPQQSTCKKCGAGEYQDQQEQIKCKNCNPGQIQYNEGQASCLQCPVGQFQNEERQQRCKLCDGAEVSPHTYQDETGQALCKFYTPCPKGFGVVEGSRTGTRQFSCKPCEFPVSQFAAETEYSPTETYGSCVTAQPCTNYEQIPSSKNPGICLNTMNSKQEITSVRKGNTKSKWRIFFKCKFCLLENFLMKKV